MSITWGERKGRRQAEVRSHVGCRKDGVIGDFSSGRERPGDLKAEPHPSSGLARPFSGSTNRIGKKIRVTRNKVLGSY